MAQRLQSLTTRLALANAIAMVALVAAAALWLLRAERAERDERRLGAQEHVLRFARLTGPALVAAWRDGDLAVRAGAHLGLEPATDRLRLLTAEGELLFDSDPAAGADPGLADAARGAVRDGEARVIAGDPGLAVVPVGTEDETRVLVFSLSYEQAEGHLRWAVATVTGLALLLAGVGGGIGYLFARRLTTRLETLSMASRAIAEGHFVEALDGGGRDEFGALARSMNEMASRLQENIAQLEESNRRLAGANRELTELDQLKSDLIANVSHELRTPLTAIRGYTDYMVERKLGAISPSQEKGLQVVRRNLDRLSRTVNALLDYSHLEAGRLSLNRQPFALTLLVEQVYQSLRSMIEKKGLTFASDVPLELPEVEADREKLSQVFENLVINAVKFTPEGGRIAISGTREGETVRVEVRDTGIGIAPEQVSRIFARFHQVDGSSRRSFGGVGLGLAIVKSILDAHSVGIEVESEPGAGTCFRFALPVAPPPASADTTLLVEPSA